MEAKGGEMGEMWLPLLIIVGVHATAGAIGWYVGGLTTGERRLNEGAVAISLCVVLVALVVIVVVGLNQLSP